MVKSKSLVEGIGNVLTTKKYYDDWSDQYNFILNQWHYKVPKKSINLFSKLIKGLKKLSETSKYFFFLVL